MIRRGEARIFRFWTRRAIGGGVMAKLKLVMAKPVTAKVRVKEGKGL